MSPASDSAGGPDRRPWRFAPLLGALVLYAFVVVPALPPGSLRSLVLDTVFSLVLLAAVASMTASPRLRAVGLGLAAVSLLAHWAPRLTDLPYLPQLSLAAPAVLLGLVALVLLGEVLSTGRELHERLQGAVAVYLLLALLWVLLYALCESISPGSFDGLGEEARLDGGRSGFLYFSFATLTTLGYGDIVPLAAGARSLAMLEAVTGQIYLAVLIARLVGEQVAASARR